MEYTRLAENRQDEDAGLDQYSPDEEAGLEIKDYLLNNGYWFELCMNIQQAWVYCEPGRKTTDRDHAYPTYEKCVES